MASGARGPSGAKGGSGAASDLIRARRAGRRIAFAAIFEADFGQRTAPAILERHLAETEGDPQTADVARTIVDGVVKHRDSIDAEIGRLAPQYPVVQLARIDRALLRCALGEVLHSPTPARVAIAEWVELARIYSGEPMRRLMNGVLGRVAPATSDPARQAPRPSSEEGVSGQHVRSTQEDRRRAARRRRG
jgi:N utilization substance protein B